MVGLEEKNFQNISSEMAGKRYFDIGFCKYSKHSYTCFQQLQKPYIALNSPKLIYF